MENTTNCLNKLWQNNKTINKYDRQQPTAWINYDKTIKQLTNMTDSNQPQPLNYRFPIWYWNEGTKLQDNTNKVEQTTTKHFHSSQQTNRYKLV